MTDLWIVERPQRFYGVEVGARTTIVPLSDGGLLVHSPVALDAGLRAAVEARGEVRAIVAASAFHHLYVQQWMDAWPAATVHCSPKLLEKRADVAWTGPLGDAPDPAWRDTLDQVHFSARTWEDEVVFFHRPTRTMICADAIFNFWRHERLATRLVAAMLGNFRPGATWLERFQIHDPEAARRQVDRMLAWGPERIVLGHGPLVEKEGTAVLTEAYGFL